MMKSGPVEIGESATKSSTLVNKGVAIIDFILRILAFAGTLGSAILMGTTDQRLPFFTQFVQFRARFRDLPSFTFFVAGNAVVSGYLILSLGFSIFHIIRSHAQRSRIVLVFLDVAMLTLLTAAASSAAAIVYLAHQGNASANWLTICQQYNSFCQRTSGSLIGSYVAVVTFIVLIWLSGAALSRR